MGKYALDLKKIRSLRRDNEITIDAAANRLKISDVQFSKKERGIAPFKGDELCELAEMYDVIPGIFFTDSVRNLETKQSDISI